MWSDSYQTLLLEKVGEKIPELANYPSFRYPNSGSETLVNFFPDAKILLFGYGSLINKESAGRNVSATALETMRPVVAFGGKRIFNYQAKKTDHWGENQDLKEKAMANLMPTFEMGSLINGVVFEINEDELASLVIREKGYDLVPIAVASWDDAIVENPAIKIEVAYTFIASPELRQNTQYTSTEYYPVRGYLQAIRAGANEFGREFADFWDSTTYLADGTTSISDWDQNTFKGVLCTRQSIS